MTFEEKIKWLEALDKYIGQGDDIPSIEAEIGMQTKVIEKAIKSAERVVRTLQSCQSKVRLGEDQAEIDRAIECVLANEDAAFIELGQLATYHSKGHGGGEFARFIDADLPDIGLFKRNDEEYCLVLPPFRSIQYKGTNEYNGAGISKLVRDCCIAYEKQTGISLTPCWKYTRITITNYVNKLTGDTVDPSNMDCKAAIDALQGYLIAGDTISDIEVVLRGKLEPENRPRTEIKIERIR